MPPFRTPQPSFVLRCAFLFLCLFAAPAAAVDPGLGLTSALAPTSIRAVRTQDQVHGAYHAGTQTTLWAWRDSRAGSTQIYAARTDAAGALLDPNGILVAAGDSAVSEPGVSAHGSGWLVTWTEGANGSDIRGRILDDDGTMPAVGFLVSGGPGAQRRAATTFDGALHIVVLATDTLGVTALRGTTVSPAGFSYNTGTASRLTTQAGDHPDVAAQADTALVVFHANRLLLNIEAYCFRVRGTTNGTNPVPRVDAGDLVLHSSSSYEEFPSVAAHLGPSLTPQGWAVAFTRRRTFLDTDRNVLATRVTRNRTVALPSPLTVNATAADDGPPDVTYSTVDASFPIVWRSGAADVVAATMSAAGALAIAPVMLDDGIASIGEPAWAHVPGTLDLCAFARQDGDETGTQDIVLRATGGDLSAGARRLVSQQTPDQRAAALAFANFEPGAGVGKWLVAWRDDRFGPGQGQVRIGFSDGAVLADTLHGQAWAAAEPRSAYPQDHPCVVTDGTLFYVFWDELRAVDGPDLHCSVWDAATEALVDTFVVSYAFGSQAKPAATVWQDRVYVVWVDRRTGGRELYSRMLLDGAPLAAESKVVSGNQVDDPAVAADLDGTALVVYQGGFVTSDVFRAFVDLTSAPPPLVSDDFIFGLPGADTVASSTVQWVGGRWFVGLDIVRAASQLHDTYALAIGPDGTTLAGPTALALGQQAPADVSVAATGYGGMFAWTAAPVGGARDVVTVDRSPALETALPAPLDVDGAAALSQQGRVASSVADRFSIVFSQSVDDAGGSGLRLMGTDGRDSLIGKVVINEFLPAPTTGRREFHELKNIDGTITFDLRDWALFANANVDGITCVGPPDCAVPLVPGAYSVDSTYTVSDFFHDRHARLVLKSPGGVVVDRVAYGDSGAAPVSAGLPVSLFSAGGPPRAGGAAGASVRAEGDSIVLTTSRLPDGSDTDDDALDFNLEPGGSINQANTGQPADLGTALFITRVQARGTADAIELFNPGETSVDFAEWYLSDGDAVNRLGIPGSQWSLLRPGQKLVLRQGEPGSFSFGLDYDDVLYLYRANFSRVEQLGWWRSDGAWPDSCAVRVPETGGFHDGNSWLTSGGQQVYTTGELRYEGCGIGAPAVDVAPVPVALAFAGVWPTPARAGEPAAIHFRVPGRPGEGSTPVRLRLYDAAGRLVRTLVDDRLTVGDHRLPFDPRDRGGRLLGAGVYFAELAVGDRRLTRNVVLVP